ncbi:nuclease-related domain-containing protein [Pseudoneobacillus sp. C159]
MILKERSESEELLILRSLNTRMELTDKEKQHYVNLERGYEGEVKFDLMAKGLQDKRHVINDLLVEVNGSFSQIDSSIISQSVIYVLDIKNYQGDFYLESDKFYSLTNGREYKNPIIQLNRCATLFRQLLQNLKLNYVVEAYIIFINPEFTLYQAPMNQPIILPTQVNRFLNDLHKTPSALNDGHMKLAQQLISLHQPKNPFTILPSYHYNQLQPGNYCKGCKSFFVYLENNIFVCGKCGEKESIEQTILRNAREFQLLFPNQKLTTQSVYDWCRVDLNRKTICRVLKKHYTAIGNTFGTYYE